MREKLIALAQQHKEDMLSFAQELLRTPSLPGQEGEIAKLVARRMEALGYDRVWIDEVGNAIGLVRGEKGGRSLMLNSHLDHVDPGREEDWPYPPYSGERAEGAIWGRGASDTKGALACQVYALGALRQADLRPPGDVYMAAVVLEEAGGIGTLHLLDRVRPDYAILGEATSNQLARGHRGRVELVVRVRGRSAHASVPERGVNPHYVLARFLRELEALPMTESPEFISSSVAPTLYLCDQRSSNVIPGECELHLDWRTVPEEEPEEIVERMRRLAEKSLIPGSSASVEAPEFEERTYTGLTRKMPRFFHSFLLPLENPLVGGSRRILEEALGRPVEVMTWRFCTDGGHLMRAGIPTIGFAPGDEGLVHTAGERISVARMEEALVGYMALALGLTRPDQE